MAFSLIIPTLQTARKSGWWMLMEKYTFENVDDSWTKMCYYYQNLGPNK